MIISNGSTIASYDAENVLGGKKEVRGDNGLVQKRTCENTLHVAVNNINIQHLCICTTPIMHTHNPFIFTQHNQ